MRIHVTPWNCHPPPLKSGSANTTFLWPRMHNYDGMEMDGPSGKRSDDFKGAVTQHYCTEGSKEGGKGERTTSERQAFVCTVRGQSPLIILRNVLTTHSVPVRVFNQYQQICQALFQLFKNFAVLNIILKKTLLSASVLINWMKCRQIFKGIAALSYQILTLVCTA
jgi:hypothetical protein